MNKKQFKNRQFHVEARDLIIVVLCILLALSISFFANTYRTTEEKFNIENTYVDFIIQTPGMEQIAEIQSLNHIDAVTPYYFASCEADIDGKTVKAELYMIEDSTAFSNTLFSEQLLKSGSVPSSNDVIAVDTTIASKYGVSVGDLVTIKSGNGSVKCEIVAIYEADGRHDSGMMMALYAGELCTMLNSKADLKYSGAYIKSSDLISTETFLKSFVPTGDLRSRDEFNSDELYNEYLELRKDTDYTQTMFYRGRYVQELNNRYDGKLLQSIIGMDAALVITIIAVAVFLSKRVVGYVKTDLIKDVRNNFKEEQEMEMFSAYLIKVTIASALAAAFCSAGVGLIFFKYVGFVPVCAPVVAVIIGGVSASVVALRKAKRDFFIMAEQEKKRTQRLK